MYSEQDSLASLCTHNKMKFFDNIIEKIIK